jgi:hypothetical protein
MIYAFLIHSSENVGQIFFSHFYSGEGNDQSKISRQQTIIRKVIEDKSFQQHAASYYPTRLDLRVLSQSTINSLTTSKKISETYSATSAEIKHIPVPTEGVVMINAPGLFENNLVAVWKQFGDLMFTAVCDPRDNLAIFGNTTLLVIEQVCSRFGINKLGKKIVEETDQVELIIAPFFRQGVPLFVNNSLHRYMAKSEESSRPFLV